MVMPPRAQGSARSRLRRAQECGARAQTEPSAQGEELRAECRPEWRLRPDESREEWNPASRGRELSSRLRPRYRESPRTCQACAAAEPRAVERLRDLPHVPCAERSRRSPRRESVAPAASAAVFTRRASTPSTMRSAHPRGALRQERIERTTPPKVDAPKIRPREARGAKSDLASDWRKFLDRLTGTRRLRRRARAPRRPRRRRWPSSHSRGSPLGPEVRARRGHRRIPGSACHGAVGAAARHSQGAHTSGQRASSRRSGASSSTIRRPTIRRSTRRRSRSSADTCQREFPLCTVYDFYDFQRNAQVFQLQDNHGKVTQLITMTAEFFDTHRDLEIRAWIEKHRVAQAGDAPGRAVRRAGLAGRPSRSKRASPFPPSRPSARTSPAPARFE